ncbi:unnamed protein product [Lampetra planeri]
MAPRSRLPHRRAGSLTAAVGLTHAGKICAAAKTHHRDGPSTTTTTTCPESCPAERRSPRVRLAPRPRGKTEASGWPLSSPPLVTTPSPPLLLILLILRSHGAGRVAPRPSRRVKKPGGAASASILTGSLVLPAHSPGGRARGLRPGVLRRRRRRRSPHLSSDAGGGPRRVREEARAVHPAGPTPPSPRPAGAAPPTCVTVIGRLSIVASRSQADSLFVSPSLTIMATVSA